MHRKTISAIVSCAILLSAVPLQDVSKLQAFAAGTDTEAAENESTYESARYLICGDHIEITGCIPKTREMIIPSEIDGLPVTTIREGAFQKNGMLDSLMIPESVVEIKANAFAGCDVLNTIYYKGSAAQWDAITVEDGNQRLIFVDIYCDFNKPAVERENVFKPGKDNWCFRNSHENFGNGSYVMTEEHSALASERIKLSAGTVWEGSCYGMAVTTVLACAGLLDPASLQADASSLYEIDAPPELNVLSTINYYFRTQFSGPQYLRKNQFSESSAMKIQRLLDYLADDSPVLLSINGYWGEVDGYANHSVVAYDVVYGSYEWDGITYDGKVLIYDNNYPELPDECCLYFNSDDLTSYTLPQCGIISGKHGGILSVMEDIDILNYHGLYCGKLHADSASNHVIVSGDMISVPYSLHTAAVRDQNWSISETLDEKAISYVSQKGEMQFALESESGYALQTESPVLLDLTVPYEASPMQIYADSAAQAVFTPNGYAQLGGTDMDFCITMASESEMWEQISVKGSGADSVMIEQTENGWILRSDNLHAVSLRVKDSDTAVHGAFSTDHTKVFLSVSESGKINAFADTDNDGSYETDVPVNMDYVMGDVNNDGEIDAVDSAFVLTAASVGVAGRDSRLSLVQESAADVKQNSTVNAYDASYILSYSAKRGAGSELTFEEYMDSVY